ncbi:adenylate/guanylate cyclase domain-containing protein [Luteolibacter luteus]|uniref:Adenylate/guanylate cyclase domain-containing protein n=1 Tax=Luteolibacter luteus TaxID=2728835 RepID=A0A858RR48_9BACT|nr:adenylate/guanylate cyclase domain-containing protein [Luteolibacter luteus]QJE98403.1 adenylate/guanylate cyclase domain-containing protein [Luteolibacter luteus]
MNFSPGKLCDDTSGQEFPLDSLNVIGRTRESGIMVDDPRVSRRHAMIRQQDDGYWFLDLGSTNGSYINGKRVTTSQRLSPGDMIRISERHFRFDGDRCILRGDGETTLSDRTIIDVRMGEVVMLVSDIQGFTKLSEKLSPDQLAPVIGSWYHLADRILADHGATIDKFIGDCVLGYWQETTPAARLAALKAAHEMGQACATVQEQHHGLLGTTGLTFRSGTGVHMGSAAYGAIGPGEFTLIGDAVNLTFRLEALTREVDHNVLLSSELLSGWQEGRDCCRCLGPHHVKGRDHTVEVYALERAPASTHSV